MIMGGMIMANTENISNYTDIGNNIRLVKHSTIINSENKKELEERIVNEIYRVFTHKAS